MDEPNKDQVEGRTDQTAGEVKEIVGEATGNKDLERDGLGEQVAGKAQEKDGDRQEDVADALADGDTAKLREAMKD